MIDIKEEAKLKFALIEKNQNKARFKHVVGRLIAAKLFQNREDIPLYTGKLPLADYIWAGKFEPRILELLPALLIKKPGIFTDLEACPEDLRKIVANIRKGKASQSFHNIPPKAYLRWIPLVGHKGVQPSYLKSFRFQKNDLDLLESLKQKGYSEIGAVRKGLQVLNKLDEATNNKT